MRSQQAYYPNARGVVVWMIGLSGSGKSTICDQVASRLRTELFYVRILDGDEVRSRLCSDLGFTLDDRRENIRRIAYVAEELAALGAVVLVATISPLESMRQMVMTIVPDVVTAYIDAPLEVCEARDPKGLYRRARSGEIQDFTGIGSPFEVPLCADIVCTTAVEAVEVSCDKLIDAIRSRLEVGVSDPRSVKIDRRQCIAVDVDGVLADYDGWRGHKIIGNPRQDVVAALMQLRSEGWKIIIHTTRQADLVRAYLDCWSIPYDEINENSDYVSGGNKPVATVYWDDRAFRYSGNAFVDILQIRRFRTWSGRI